MNESPLDNQPSEQSDELMDGLLKSFFRKEAPEKLSQLPSEWDDVQRDKLLHTEVLQAEVSEGQAMPASPATSWYQSRRLIAATATVAAGLVLFLVFASPLMSPTDNGGQTAEVQDPDSQPAIDKDATFNVSSDDPSQAVDDANTSLQEIDDIDLSPKDKDDDLF